MLPAIGFSLHPRDFVEVKLTVIDDNLNKQIIAFSLQRLNALQEG